MRHVVPRIRGPTSTGVEDRAARNGPRADGVRRQGHVLPGRRGVEGRDARGGRGRLGGGLRAGREAVPDGVREEGGHGRARVAGEERGRGRGGGRTGRERRGLADGSGGGLSLSLPGGIGAADPGLTAAAVIVGRGGAGWERVGPVLWRLLAAVIAGRGGTGFRCRGRERGLRVRLRARVTSSSMPRRRRSLGVSPRSEGVGRCAGGP